MFQQLANLLMARHLVSPMWLEETSSDDDESLMIQFPSCAESARLLACLRVLDGQQMSCNARLCRLLIAHTVY